MNLNSRAWCDIIFEERNKVYGAYVMRRTSQRRHLLAFIITMLALTFGIGIPMIVDNLLYTKYQQQEESIMVEQYHILDAILEEDMLPDLKKPVIPVQKEAPPKVSTREEMIQRIKPDMLSIIENKPLEEDPFLQELLQEEQLAKDEAKTEQEEPAPVDDQLYTKVEVMPSFPGGEKGLMEFLSRNLRYPYSLKDKKIENTVICSFFIEKDGSLKQATVMQSANILLDREALRVLRLLPKWIPAKKNGQPIRVKYILPVSFRLK